MWQHICQKHVMYLSFQNNHIALLCTIHWFFLLRITNTQRQTICKYCFHCNRSNDKIFEKVWYQHHRNSNLLPRGNSMRTCQYSTIRPPSARDIKQWVRNILIFHISYCHSFNGRRTVIENIKQRSVLSCRFQILDNYLLWKYKIH